jgi:hypothetical protein
MHSKLLTSMHTNCMHATKSACKDDVPARQLLFMYKPPSLLLLLLLLLVVVVAAAALQCSVAAPLLLQLQQAYLHVTLRLAAADAA